MCHESLVVKVVQELRTKYSLSLKSMADALKISKNFLKNIEKCLFTKRFPNNKIQAIVAYFKDNGVIQEDLNKISESYNKMLEFDKIDMKKTLYRLLEKVENDERIDHSTWEVGVMKNHNKSEYEATPGSIWYQYNGIYTGLCGGVNLCPHMKEKFMMSRFAVNGKYDRRLGEVIYKIDDIHELIEFFNVEGLYND